MILLSRPVAPVAPVIEAALADWEDPSLACRALLPCRHRPVDPLAVSRMLTAALEGPLPSAAAAGDPVLLCLANLDQCFLRCIDGWSGIERLRQVAQERRDRFWLLGCNSWAWTFLDHVSQISSYFPDAMTLPPLDGAALREWLSPVASDLELEQTARFHARWRRGRRPRRRCHRSGPVEPAGGALRRQQPDRRRTLAGFPASGQGRRCGRAASAQARLARSAQSER